MSIKSLAALATLSDAAKRFEYDHEVWAKLKHTVDNVPYSEGVSIVFSKVKRGKRLSQAGRRKWAGLFYTHAVESWGVGEETGTREEFVDHFISEGLFPVFNEMMAHAADPDEYRIDSDDEVDGDEATDTPAEAAEGN